MDEGGWELGPFNKNISINPVLTPLDSTIFFCPVRQDNVYWESKDVFNPAAVIRNDTLFLIYRAEDKIGKFSGTSRLGLAYSLDGTTFIRRPEPVLYPENDEFVNYEWEGGIEDPRIVETEDGRYVLTYTSYDGEYARLFVAESSNLVLWQKHGPVFAKAYEGRFLNHWSKAGAIVSKRDGDKFIAAKINESYWMYWGDTDIFLATSKDLINWAPVLNEDGTLKSVLKPREKMFDSRLVESGPPAIITSQGVLLLYNGMNLDAGGDPELPAGTYSSGQALFDINDPSSLSKRSSEYFLSPDQEYEIQGQVGNVCFIEGLVAYKGSWFLYYGTADSKIAVATAKLD
jgi:beta-1,2-mannosidase